MAIGSQASESTQGRGMRGGARCVVCAALPLLLIQDVETIVSQFFGQTDLCQVSGLEVTASESGRYVSFAAETEGLLEATVTLSVTSVNLTAPVPLPLTVDVAGATPVELLRMRVTNTLREWFYSYQYTWRAGRRGGVHDDTYVYALPYDRDRAFPITQGRLGTASHGPGSGAENAIDFGLPEGTTVRAARPGMVVALRDTSAIGGPDPSFGPCANFVTVRHLDGTYGFYGHLRRRSSLVKLGQTVVGGTPLAESGKTGYATEAHLHFEVFRNIDGSRGETFPVSFATSEGVVSDPRTGHSYRNP